MDSYSGDPVARRFDRLMALGAYGLLGVSVFTLWVPAIIAAVIAYTHRREADPLVASHFRFQITTFWIGFVLVLAAVIVYGWMVSADSATLTAGTVENADPRYRGATMAVHSTIGFMGAVLGPILFGFVLDAGGGVAVGEAWGWAFAAMAVLIALGPICVYGLHGSDRRGS